MNTTTPKPIHGEPKPQRLAPGAKDISLVACAFKVGDRVTYTNDYGVKFPGKTVMGFSHDEISIGFGRFVFIDTDCFWCPTKPGNLKLEPATA